MSAAEGSSRKRWGRRREAPPASAELAPVLTAPPALPVSLEKFSTPVLKKHFLILIEDLSSAVKAKNGDAEDKAYISKYVERILTAALRIDPWRLNANNTRELTNAIYQLLPRAIEECTTNALEEDWGFARELTEDLFRRAYTAINGIVRLQMDPEYLANFVPQQVEVAAGDGPLAAVAFPSLAPFNPELDAAVKTLEAKWTRASQLELGVEDRFLLEQIATNYLPDSWAMLVSFTSLPEETRQRAAAMVHEQLDILTVQVDDLLSRGSAHSLNALKIQTDFIRAQKLNKDGAALKLPTSPTQRIVLDHEPSAGEA